MRVAIYTRVSTNRQAQTQTIAQQLERLQAHVEAQGWVLEPEHIYPMMATAEPSLIVPDWIVCAIMLRWRNSTLS
jgi:hypothetical protein